METPDYSNLSVLILNCSLKPSSENSHTKRLLDKVSEVIESSGATVESLFIRDFDVPFGMVKDATKDGSAEKDNWPSIQEKVMKADILIIGTPIWLGVKSSVATLAVERLYAASADKNEKGQYLYYGKVGGCVVTGNEDGVKAVSSEVLYALQHIGYTIPPQADCGWIGEVGPGLSYGDVENKGDIPSGYDNDFTNKNATIMAWNLLHTAAMLKKNGGIPVFGNTAKNWKEAPHVSYNKD